MALPLDGAAGLAIRRLGDRHADIGPQDRYREIGAEHFKIIDQRLERHHRPRKQNPTA